MTENVNFHLLRVKMVENVANFHPHQCSSLYHVKLIFIVLVEKSNVYEDGLLKSTSKQASILVLPLILKLMFYSNINTDIKPLIFFTIPVRQNHVFCKTLFKPKTLLRRIKSIPGRN